VVLLKFGHPATEQPALNNGTAYDLDSLERTGPQSLNTRGQCRIEYNPAGPILDTQDAPTTNAPLGTSSNWTYHKCTNAATTPFLVSKPNAAAGTALGTASA